MVSRPDFGQQAFRALARPAVLIQRLVLGVLVACSFLVVGGIGSSGAGIAEDANLLTAPQVSEAVDAAEDPAVGFSEWRFPTIRQLRLGYLNSRGAVSGLDEFGGHVFFGTAEVEGTGVEGSGLAFAVEEQPDKGLMRFCEYARRPCNDISVGIFADTGQMFIFADYVGGRLPCSGCMGWHVADYPDHRVELSAANPEGSLRVHQEVLVEFSAERPDCSDFPDNDGLRYSCLFLGEWRRAEPPETPQLLRDDLPGLVQPSENYSLVLAEEFDGASEVDGCEHGMNSLDPAVWNFDLNPCNNRDADGTLCVDVADGDFVMRMSASPECRTEIRSRGHFTYKYGYLEVKYRVRLTDPIGYTNFQLASGDAAEPLTHKFNHYGGPRELDSYEKIARTIGTVINVFEYVPRYRKHISHQWINHRNYTTAGDTRRYRSNKDYYYRSRACQGHQQCLCPSTGCSRNAWVTMTMGLEWTPRGYRTFIKVDGIHDDFVVVPQDWVEVQKVGPYEIFEDQDQFFEYLIEGDQDSILEQVAISHIPHELDMSVWGYPSSAEYERLSEMRVDYIRVFQPENLYLDMEPVYK